jgi:hypothetical protein
MTEEMMNPKLFALTIVVLLGSIADVGADCYWNDKPYAAGAKLCANKAEYVCHTDVWDHLGSCESTSAEPRDVKKRTSSVNHGMNATIVGLDTKTITLKVSDAMETVTVPLEGQALAEVIAFKPSEEVSVMCKDNAKGEHGAVFAIAPATTKNWCHCAGPDGVCAPCSGDCQEGWFCTAVVFTGHPTCGCQKRQ